MGKLFNRQAAVTIDTVRVTGLDVRFEIEKALKPQPNKAKIEIFNLNPDHRAQFQRDGDIQARLEVGYDNETLQQIFLGDLRRGYSVYEPPDWRTVITSGDGEKRHKGARMNVSYAAGTAVDQVGKDIVQALGVGVGNALQALTGSALRGGLTQYTSGKVVAGKVSDILAKHMASVGKEYSVQDGAVQVLDIGQTLQSTAVLLSADTGLIGSPEPGTKGLLKLKALLQAQIFPGRKIQVDSVIKNVSGFYRVEVCKYKGDTAGQDWYVEIEAKAI